MPVKKVCVVCGQEFSVPPCREKTASTCSNKCAISVRAKSRERKATFRCKNCGKEVEIQRSYLNRRVFCSNECRFASEEYKEGQRKRVTMEANPMWKGGEPNHTDGYVYKKEPSHPYSSNGYIFKHRLVMEEWLREDNPTSEFLIKLGNKLYLSLEAVVHHIDWDKKNNKRRNLIVCSRGFHSSLHNGNFIKGGEYWPHNKRLKIGKKESKMNVNINNGLPGKDIPHEQQKI